MIEWIKIGLEMESIGMIPFLPLNHRINNFGVMNYRQSSCFPNENSGKLLKKLPRLLSVKNMLDPSKAITDGL